MSIDGHDVVLDVPHRGRDIRYPIGIDPEVVVWSAHGNFAGWTWGQSPASGPWFGAIDNCAIYCGLYQALPQNRAVANGSSASFSYWAPTKTAITQATLGGVAHAPYTYAGVPYTRAQQGILRSSGWERGRFQNQDGLQPDTGYAASVPTTNSFWGQDHTFTVTQTPQQPAQEPNRALMAISAYHPYGGSVIGPTSSYAINTMAWAKFLIADKHAPTWHASATPTDQVEWSNDNNATHTRSFRATDEGLGLYQLKLSGAASIDPPPAAQGTVAGNTITAKCSGTPPQAVCPTDWPTSPITYTLNEGVNTITASDLAANTTTRTWTEKIDRSKPQLELNGWLPNTDGMIFAGIDYDLSVAASDSVSGVKSVEVLVDDVRLPRGGFKEQDCGADGCDLILNTALIAGSYTPGPRTVKVVAKDFAGNEERVELPVEISDISAAAPRERDAISDEPVDDGPEPATEPGIDTTCDPNATGGSDTDCGRDDLADPIEQAVTNEPGLIENLATPLLNTLDALLSPLSGPQPRAAGTLRKNGSGWGLSDQKAQTFVPDNPATPNRIDNPLTPQIDEGYLDLFTALDVTRLRLVVPWDLVPRAKGNFDGDPYPKTFEHRNGPDIEVGLGPFHDDPATPGGGPTEVRAALSRLKATDEWIARTLPCEQDKRLGEVMISFEKSEEIKPGKDHENLLPKPDEYVHGVSEFRKRYLGRCQADKDRDETSRITVYTAWNEPNDTAQPTRGDRLGRAGEYWSQLNRICKTTPIKAYRCTVAAGDFTDRPYSPNPDFGLGGDVRRFQKGMNRAASAWALHAYRSSHVPFAQSEARIKRFLRLTKSQSGHEPRLWLTEQGGRVHIQAPTPAADFCNIMQFRHISNRITRLYYYLLVGPETSLNRFDSALIELSDGAIRPRDPQYETYKFYASQTAGSQRC
ncbi:MAG: hypothetical protein M3401_04345 [Actinomycetota bacterium]|nr:hypothetical protein [Actinomycetota bacterium]